MKIFQFNEYLKNSFAVHKKNAQYKIIKKYKKKRRILYIFQPNNLIESIAHHL